MSYKLKKSIKKLIHVQKACKSFTQIFRSKFQSIRVRNAIKNVTTFFVLSRPKIRILPMRQRSSRRHHYPLLEKGFPAIFIDELYVPKSGQPSRKQEIIKDEELYVNPTSTNTIGNKMQKEVARKNDLSPHEKMKTKCEDRSVDKFQRRTQDMIREVDKRAEEFISKVRADLMLEREQSIIEFQEMLARSV